MAYVRPIEEEDKEKEAGAAIPVAEQPGGPVSGGAVAQAPAPAQEAQTKGYTDVRSYLSANRPQAGQLADVYAGRIEKEAGDIRSQIGQAQEQFGQKVEEGTGGAAWGTGAQSVIRQAIQDPTRFTSIQPQLENWQKIYNAQYAGPSGLQDIEGYQDIAGKVSSAGKFSESLQTPEGRKEMFYRYGLRPTPGNVSLNEMLISGTPEAMQRIQTAGAGLGEIPEYMKGIEATAKEQAAARQQALDEARTAAREALTGEVSGLEKSLQERLQQATTGAQEEMQVLADIIRSGGQLTEGTPGYARAGMTPAQWNNIRKLEGILTDYLYDTRRDPSRGMANIDPSIIERGDLVPGQPWAYGEYDPNWRPIDLTQYMATPPGMNEGAYSIGNLATPEEYTREAALEQLAGEQIPLLFETDRPQAGSGLTTAARFDPNAAYKALYEKLAAEDARTLQEHQEKFGSFSPNRIDWKQYDTTKQTPLIQALARQAGRGKLTPEQQNLVDVMTGKVPTLAGWGPNERAPEFKKLFESVWNPEQQLQGDQWTEPTQPVMPEPVPPSASDRLEYIRNPETGQNELMWKDPQGYWKQAPQEFKYTKGGQPSGPGDFDKVEQFDYLTGTYKEIPEPEGGWRSGGRRNGVNVPGNIPGVVYAFGMPSQPQQPQQIDQKTLEDYLKQFRGNYTPETVGIQG